MGNIITVQKTMAQELRQLLSDIFIILGIALGLSLVVVLTQLDKTLAVELYNPQNPAAQWLRQHSSLPGIVVGVISLGFILAWPLRLKFPTLRRLSVVWLLTLIFGGGLLVSLMGKELVDRPRPRETELLGGNATYSQIFQPAAIEGKSFPSGHAVMGFVFAVPFFVLRRSRKKLAYGFLALGLVGGFSIGSARMVLGAHFLTDIIWAGAFTFIAAAASSCVFSEKRDLPNKFTVPFLLLIGFGMVWFNKFTVTLNHMPAGDVVNISIPCKDIILENGEPFKVATKVKGYGAPISNLQLVDLGQNFVGLINNKGLYRDLRCQTTVTLPKGKQVRFPINTYTVGLRKPIPKALTLDARGIATFEGINTKKSVDNAPVTD